MKKSSRHHSINVQASNKKPSEAPLKAKLAQAQAEVERLIRLQAVRTSSSRHKMFDPMAGP
jgi:hypothetical protein